MKLTFLGAAHEVTGSCTLLSACGYNVLIDCGMEQGEDIYENVELPIAPGEIDCVFLTHAHIDHSGKLPALTARGYDGAIYATGATTKLCGIMLLDSAHIQESEAQWKNRKSKRSGGKEYVPEYTVEDAQHCLTQFVPCEYGETVEPLSGIKARFIDAGHLLGSSSIEFTVTEDGVTKKIVFSGDVGNIDRPLIRDPQKPDDADFVVIESTYGDRLHGERKDYVTQLATVIQETFDRRGNVIIPSFAVGRTQEMLYLIRGIKEKGLVHGHDNFEVRVDSPLAIEATRIYSSDMRGYYDEEALEAIKNGKNILRFDGLKFSVTSEESKFLNTDPTPRVILSASGMCEAGRIRHHLKHNLWRSESTILFVGYQSEGTLGRILLDGAKKVKIFGEEIQVRAHIEQMDGISGHADMNMLIGWLGALGKKPSLVFVNHGEDGVCDSFANTVKEKLGYEAQAPYNGAVYDLTAGVWENTGSRVRITKKSPQERTTAQFAGLLDAGRRLMTLIDRSKGLANREAEKFAAQINELVEKWKN